MNFSIISGMIGNYHILNKIRKSKLNKKNNNSSNKLDNEEEKMLIFLCISFMLPILILIFITIIYLIFNLK